MDYIRVKKRDILKVEIQDEDGNPKLDEYGEKIFLEFDLEDITVPDRYNKCFYLVKKALKTLKTEIAIINKKQDCKGKGYMSKNEEAKIQALQKYYKDTEEAMDLFLGKGGTQKVFDDTRYLTMFDDLSDMLKPIMPKLKINFESIEEKIKSKYQMQENNVLKDE